MTAANLLNSNAYICSFIPHYNPSIRPSGQLNRREAMPELTPGDLNLIASCLAGFFFGIYSGIFAIFLYTALQKGTEYGKSIVFYALCVLYALSLVIIIVDTMMFSASLYWHLIILQTVIFGCSDFIAQAILIYRCYIVWGNNIRVIIIPSILTFAFLVIWITGGAAPVEAVQHQVILAPWAAMLVTTSLAMSLTVNALVTALIVFKIVKLFREVSSTGITQSRNTLQCLIGVIIESGMALFAIQLARLVATIMFISIGYRVYRAFILSVCIHQMVNGITPTIIVVRVSMGLSYHDENSMVENSNGSMHFAPANGSIGIVD